MISRFLLCVLLLVVIFRFEYCFSCDIFCPAFLPVMSKNITTEASVFPLFYRGSSNRVLHLQPACPQIILYLLP